MSLSNASISTGSSFRSTRWWTDSKSSLSWLIKKIKRNVCFNARFFAIILFLNLQKNFLIYWVRDYRLAYNDCVSRYVNPSSTSSCLCFFGLEIVFPLNKYSAYSDSMIPRPSLCLATVNSFLHIDICRINNFLSFMEQITCKNFNKSRWMQVNKILLTRDRPEQIPSFLVRSFQWNQTTMRWSRISKAYHFLKKLANCVDSMLFHCFYDA